MHRHITVVVDDPDRVSSFTVASEGAPFLILEDATEKGGQVTITVPTSAIAVRLINELGKILAALERQAGR